MIIISGAVCLVGILFVAYAINNVFVKNGLFSVLCLTITALVFGVIFLSIVCK